MREKTIPSKQPHKLKEEHSIRTPALLGPRAAVGPVCAPSAAVHACGQFTFSSMHLR